MWQRSFAFVADSQSDLPNKLCESCDCMFIEIDDLAKLKWAEIVAKFCHFQSGPRALLSPDEDMKIWTSEHVFNHNWETVSECKLRMKTPDLDFFFLR